MNINVPPWKELLEQNGGDIYKTALDYFKLTQLIYWGLNYEQLCEIAKTGNGEFEDAVYDKIMRLRDEEFLS